MIAGTPAAQDGKHFAQPGRWLGKRVWWAGVTGAGMGLALVLYRVDPAEVGFLPRCPIRAITGHPCLGCGMTRAFHHLLRGDWRAALRLNPRIIIVVPLIAGWFLRFTRETFTDRPSPAAPS